MIPPHLHPKYWPLWLVAGFLWLMAQLPWKVSMQVGRWIGSLIWLFLRPARKRVLYTNIRLCFPELQEEKQETLAREHIHAAGQGILEVALAWWARDSQLRPLAHVSGIENLQEAMARGKGVILLSAHFTSLEMGGRLLGFQTPFHVVYRSNENPMTEYLLKRNRQKHSDMAIDKRNIKQMVRSLRSGNAVWYAPDQDMISREPLFAPFMGIMTATNTATSRLAKISHAPVVPYAIFRRKDGKGYDLEFQPALDGFPSGDDLADATRINRIFEEWIRRQPEDYFWFHKRFKQRPPGEPDPYA
jgi:KDO2-lipid IV(A) lauroyltransferase